MLALRLYARVQVKVNLFPNYFIQSPRKPELMLLLSMRKNEISIPAGLQKESNGGKPKLMALSRHGENQHIQSLLSFRETKHSITTLLLTYEKHKLLSSYSLHENGY